MPVQVWQPELQSDAQAPPLAHSASASLRPKTTIVQSVPTPTQYEPELVVTPVCSTAIDHVAADAVLVRSLRYHCFGIDVRSVGGADIETAVPETTSVTRFCTDAAS